MIAVSIAELPASVSEGKANYDEGHGEETEVEDRGRGGRGRPVEAVLLSVGSKDGLVDVVVVVVEDERAEDAPPRARLPRHGLHSGGHQPRTQPRQASVSSFLNNFFNLRKSVLGKGFSVLDQDLTSKHPFD